MYKMLVRAARAVLRSHGWENILKDGITFYKTVARDNVFFGGTVVSKMYDHDIHSVS